MNVPHSLCHIVPHSNDGLVVRSGWSFLSSASLVVLAVLVVLVTSFGCRVSRKHEFVVQTIY